jgi:CubicO group peptidase (beta-lactamase class C family)
MGKLKLDDSVGTYVPNFPSGPNSTVVTIRQLLNHSSGLPNPMPIRWVHPASEDRPNPTSFLKPLSAEHRKLKSNPGEKASYSNIGYVALGAVVSAAAGVPYEDYVRERILKPLGMQHTDFRYTREMLPDAATGYQKRWSWMAMLVPFLRIPKGVLDGRIGPYRAFNRFYVDGSSYGGLVGPVRDAARFVQAHLNGGRVDGAQALSSDSVEAMQRISARGGRIDVGLGWFRGHSDAVEAYPYLEQLGGGAGFFNDMRIYPDNSFGIVGTGNSTSYDIERVIAAVNRVDWSRPSPPTHA